MTPAPDDYDHGLTILHADMDAFYAAVEVLDDPTLAGKPLIVGHEGRRGVVSTASYEARRFGVHSAQPSAVARRLCPQAVWRAPRMERYAELSRTIRGIFHRYTPAVEPLSLDEAFLDVTGSLRLFGGAVRIAEAVRRDVRAESGGLTVSVGVAENMFLAKLASDMKKPDGLMVIPPGRAPEVLAPLPVERLWGVGKKTAAVLHRHALRTVGDLVRLGDARLRSIVGDGLGTHLWELAHGRDSRHVSTEREAKSISSENTFGEDLHVVADIERALFEAAEAVARALRRAGLRARTVHLKVRTGSYKTMTRDQTIAAPTDLAEDLYRTALALFRERVDLGGEGVRLIGVGAHGLVEAERPAQRDLFDGAQTSRGRRAARLLDAAEKRLGTGALRRARLVDPPDAPHGPARPGANDPGRVRRSDLE